MRRKAMAVWNGSLKEGKGTLSTDSKVLNNTPYNFVSRFEQGANTNPEELIAAAHAGCFSMALANELTKGGNEPKSIQTTATVTLENLTVTAVHLDTKIAAPGADKSVVEAAAQGAKTNCVISRLLNAKITLSVAVN